MLRITYESFKLKHVLNWKSIWENVIEHNLTGVNVTLKGSKLEDIKVYVSPSFMFYDGPAELKGSMKMKITSLCKAVYSDKPKFNFLS